MPAIQVEFEPDEFGLMANLVEAGLTKEELDNLAKDQPTLRRLLDKIYHAQLQTKT